ISDISALSGLTRLTDLSLGSNNISDISALSGLTQLTKLGLRKNPLNAAAIDTHIPAIQANGTSVYFDYSAPTTLTGPVDLSQPAIYWRGGGSIHRANFDGSNIQTLTGAAMLPTLDVAAGKMYWISGSPSKIQRANLDGSNVETLVTEEYINNLTLDVSGGKMYWINSNRDAGTSKIRRANLDGSNVKILRAEDQYTADLVLDVSGGKMYWIDWDRENDEPWGVFHRRPKIRRANLDGSNVETLRAEKEFVVEALTLDISSGKMYWLSGYDRDIHRANLDGSNVQTLVVSEAEPHQLALDVAGGKMYWIGREGPGLYKIFRANLNGSNVETLVKQRYTRDVTLDVAAGKMYWIGVDGGADKIRRANLDGSNIEDIITAPVEYFVLIPSQTPMNAPSMPVVSKKPEVDTQQVHVDAADRPPMYWINTTAGTLHRLVDAEVENLLPSVRNANSLTLDVVNDKLYWTEKTSNTTGRVRRADLDGSNVASVREFNNVPLGIAVDTSNGKLYVTNSRGKVQRLNLDGSNYEWNFIVNLDSPKGIAVDAAGRKVYWTEQTGENTGRIRRADLDGSNVASVREFNNVPLGIAVDTSNGKLYVTNSRGKVQRLNLDGSNYEWNFIVNLDSPKGIAVDAAGQKLYLTSSDGKISRRNLSGGGSQVVVEGLVSPGNIVLNNSITAPEKSSTSETPASKNKYDVNGDGTVNDADASLVSEAISNGSTDAKYDVNNDGKVNFDDLKLVLDNRDRDPYDVNGDGTVDDTDASLVSEAISNGSTDATYDVNDDGKVNFDDLKLVLDNRAEGAAGAPLIVGNLKLNAAQIARIEAQINLLLATGDQSPAAMRTLVYLQQLLTTARPEETQLLANYPNPFNPETWIPYQLAEPAEVTVSIYAIDGKLVRTLALGHQAAGIYQYRNRAAYWDGRNDVGESVASGVYFYTLTAGDFTATRKMLIWK
ncbi:MAG: DUF5050 domain-containing protein, partial [Candidatus Poribacteria bacterium]|nr:DUF5050 domain-containing protein [Candidatus Poribacteria bacterium]